MGLATSVMIAAPPHPNTLPEFATCAMAVLIVGARGPNGDSVVLQISVVVEVDSLPDEPAVAHIPGEPVQWMHECAAGG